jgi:glycosyltransferase involved in cell wall biosynthesis
VTEDKPALLDEGRLLCLCYFLPPIRNGVAFVVGTLLAQFDLRNVVLFTGRRDGQYAIDGAEVRRFDVPSWWPEEDVALGRLHLPVRAVGNALSGVSAGLHAWRLLRRAETRGLFVVYPKQHFLFAACLATAFSNKPLIAYFTDIYSDTLPRRRRVARTLERFFARRVDLFFAMTDAHAEFIRKRFSPLRDRPLPIITLPPAYDAPPAPVDDGGGKLEGKPAIVFTGAVYYAQAEAIKRLIAALEHPDLAGYDVHLHLFSPMPPAELARLGIHPGPRVHIASLTQEEARGAQRRADILFLPLAFDVDPLILQTASPSKMAEYLAAARPILVHAPENAFLTRYAREEGFAEVVEEPDEGALAAAVARLASDPERVRKLLERGAATLKRHSIGAVAERFRNGVREALG